MMLVNFGCGEVYHRDWQNFDAVATSDDVRACDVRRQLPFADGTVDAVYHSHLLEHLTAADAESFLRECHRILRSGGTLRVAVPDLEGIARAYLHALAEAAAGGDPTRYDWCRLELFDQIARTKSGGAMATFVRDLTPQQLATVRQRAGSEIDSIRKMGSGARRRQITFGKVWRRIRVEFVRGVATVVGGAQSRRAFDEGWFRASGEVHRIMYDRVSLARLLRAASFSDPTVMTAMASRIPDFERFELDAVNGVVRKPDSLFMEATRS